MKKLVRFGLVLAGTPLVLAVGALCVFDVWLAYRRDPDSLDALLDSYLNER